MDNEYLAGYSEDEGRKLEKEFWEDEEKSTKDKKSFRE